MSAYTDRVERLQRLIQVADDATIAKEGYSELEIAWARMQTANHEAVEILRRQGASE